MAAAVVVAPPATAATTPALKLLSRLSVREQSPVPFDPAFFSFTSEPYTCTAATFALLRDSEIQATTGLGCQIANGRWRSYYEGTNPATYTDVSQLGVVQTMPALEAWFSGAQDWSPAQRRNFMEDLTPPASLVVVPLAVVQKRASTDPDDWGRRAVRAPAVTRWSGRR